MVGQVVVVGSSSAPVSGDEISAVWHDGVIFNSLAYANDGQDPVKCRQHQNHHTHAGAPGEGLDVSGWCDALVFRQKTFTVPSKTTSGRPLKSAALNVQLRFASGDEPPTDQLPREESKRGTCDAEVTVADKAGETIASTMGGDNVMFQSPHRLSVPVTPGATYTITVDPFAGPHVEWRIDADLALSTQ
jgi:hypothetical protein